jgi:hypothetical protein
MAEVIAGADAAIGSSFHLGVTAAAAGVPLLRPPSPPGWKYEAVEALPGVAALGSPLELGAREPSDAVLALADRVEAHWDAVAALARRGRAADPPADLAARVAHATRAILAAAAS